MLQKAVRNKYATFNNVPVIMLAFLVLCHCGDTLMLGLNTYFREFNFVAYGRVVKIFITC